MAQPPFLSALGVSAIQQARTPTADAFPIAFNPNNKAEWATAVHSIEVTGEAQTDWGLAIRQYVQLCQARGVFPFQNVHLARNDQISDFMRERRRSFVNFIDQSQFFENVKIRTTERHVTVTDVGFVLTVTATAYIKDPSFGNWLTQTPIPNFSIVGKDQHSRILEQGLRMFANADDIDKQSWNLGYEIVCPIYPDLPDQHTPSKAEIENFVLKILWMPLLKAVRPRQLTHRLI